MLFDYIFLADFVALPNKFYLNTSLLGDLFGSSVQLIPVGIDEGLKIFQRDIFSVQ